MVFPQIKIVYQQIRGIPVECSSRDADMALGITLPLPAISDTRGAHRHRRTARAELYRRLDQSRAPVSWGLRLFNGHDEQQATILLPNPFLSPDSDKVLKTPDWSRLELWDRLRPRWLGSPTRLT